MIQQEAINCSSSSKAAHTHTHRTFFRPANNQRIIFFNLEKSRFQQLQIHLPQVQNGTYHILNSITNWVRFKQQIYDSFLFFKRQQLSLTDFNLVHKWFQNCVITNVTSQVVTESSLPMFICNVNFWINTILTTTTKSGMQSILIGWN